MTTMLSPFSVLIFFLWKDYRTHFSPRPGVRTESGESASRLPPCLFTLGFPESTVGSQIVR